MVSPPKDGVWRYKTEKLPQLHQMPHLCMERVKSSSFLSFEILSWHVQRVGYSGPNDLELGQHVHDDRLSQFLS